jgi:hypothetical protein
MALTAEQYLNLLLPYLPVAVLPPDEVQAVNELRAAAANLDAQISAGPNAAIDDAKRQFRLCLDNVRERLIREVLKAVPLEELRKQAASLGLQDPGGMKLEATLGPLYVSATLPTMRLADPRDGSPLMLGPLPPDGFTARLDAGPVRGGGALVRRDDGVSGLLNANVGVMEVAALASLRRTPTGGPSFLAIISAGFTPGLQVGFGFQINRIGGVVGVERRLDPAVLARKLGDGTAAQVLFPLDAGKAARVALDAADEIFPPAAGSAVAGPTFRFSWLEVAGQGFASVDLGILIELPGPRRIAIVGVVRAGIPGPVALLRLRADIVGVLDFVEQRATVDASLVDSGALGIFTIYGDLAFASCWGPTAYTVLSIGGFYPGFRPEPAQIRPLKRLGMSLDLPLPGFRLRAEGYLAATSNTLQLGGHLEVGINAGIASVSGFIGLDALIQFTPFHLHAEVAAGLDVRFLGMSFCGVRFDGTIDGPGPLTLHGRVTVETFLKDFDWEDTFVFGASGNQPMILPQRALDVLKSEEMRPENIQARESRDPLVALFPLERQQEYAVVAPRGGLAWNQLRVPLETAIDRIDGTPIGSQQNVQAWILGESLPKRERFAPGSFITLTSAQALTAPSYDRLPSGFYTGFGLDVSAPPQPAESGPEVLKKVGKEMAPCLLASAVGFRFGTALLSMVAERDQPAVVGERRPMVEVPRTDWVSVGVGGDGVTPEVVTHSSATQALQTTFGQPGMALAAADFNRPATLEGV